MGLAIGAIICLDSSSTKPMFLLPQEKKVRWEQQPWEQAQGHKAPMDSLKGCRPSLLSALSLRSLAVT